MKYHPQLEALEDRRTPTTLPPGFVDQPVVTGLAAPTAFALAPDGRFFVDEQGGNVRVVQNGQLLPTPFLHLTVDSQGERGLLGLTFDPNFVNNHFLYVYYTVPGVGGAPSHNRVSRFTANGNQAVANSELPLMDLDNLSLTATNHNGGALHFGGDGKLYVSVGENGTPANSQTLSNRLGKILRINSDGSIPMDNPFFNAATGANKAIWALGLRNPFTFAVQPGSGLLFINDVGQSAWEEIDGGVAGANYGWPTAEGNSTNPAFVNPLFTYPHGAGTQAGNAIAGGAFYNPANLQFGANFNGLYFFGDFVNNWIRVFNPVSHAVADFASNLDGSGPTDLLVDPAGSLYYLAHNSGTLQRISSALPANEHFVNTLYSDYLGRAGSQQEIDGWAMAVPSVGRAQVVFQIQHSTEALNRQVTQLYQVVLGRSADPNGLAGWVGQLKAGASIEQVLVGLTTGSMEFANRANALIGGADGDTNFVRGLFQVLLRRSGGAVGPAEVSGWLNVLHTQGRAAVAAGIVNSPEFRVRAVQSFYGDPSLSPQPFLAFWPNLLHRTRPPSSAELSGWAASSFGLLTVELFMASSDEYFVRA